MPASSAASGAAVTMYSTKWCGYCFRLRKQLDRRALRADLPLADDAAAEVQPTFLQDPAGLNQVDLTFALAQLSHAEDHCGRRRLGLGERECETRSRKHGLHGSVAKRRGTAGFGRSVQPRVRRCGYR